MRAHTYRGRMHRDARWFIERTHNISANASCSAEDWKTRAFNFLCRSTGGRSDENKGGDILTAVNIGAEANMAKLPAARYPGRRQIAIQTYGGLVLLKNTISSESSRDQAVPGRANFNEPDSGVISPRITRFWTLPRFVLNLEVTPIW
jgi:hypothetical protein